MKQHSKVWHEIWQRKYGEGASPEAGAEIHTRDGFDSLSAQQWKRLVRYFIDKLAITEHDDVVEIGCGAGAFLEHIPRCRTLSGVDYSECAIQQIGRRLEGTFAAAEASAIPFGDRSFDVTISWSVFFYFDSLEYAQKALHEMIRITRDGGRIFVGDVNDLEKKEIALKLRRRSRSTRKKRWVINEPTDQLFFDKNFFMSFAVRNNMNITFYDEDVEELAFYENSPYRYSLTMNRT